MLIFNFFFFGKKRIEQKLLNYWYISLSRKKKRKKEKKNVLKLYPLLIFEMEYTSSSMGVKTLVNLCSHLT